MSEVDPQVPVPPPIHGDVCPRVWEGIDVDAGGTAWLCCLTCTGACERSLALGNVLDDGLTAVLTGPRAEALRRRHYDGGPDDSCCSHCDQRRAARAPFDPSIDPRERLFFLEVELTPRCNLACSMCAHTFRARESVPLHGGVAPGELLSLERFGALADAFHALHGHPKEIRLQWLGEPLLHPRFPDFLRHACADPKTVAVVTTNAVLLDDATAAAIVATPGRMRIELSINAASAASYRWITGADEYARVLAHAEGFLARRRAAGREREIAVRIKLVVQPETADEVGPFLARWRAMLDRLGSPHATWWDNTGPPAPTVLVVNPLLSDGFAPGYGLLSLARDGRPLDRAGQLRVAAALERHAGAREASAVLEHAVAPVERALDGADAPLLSLAREAFELRAAVARGDPPAELVTTLAGAGEAIERALAAGGLRSSAEWTHLSTLVRGLYEHVVRSGYAAAAAWPAVFDPLVLGPLRAAPALLERPGERARRGVSLRAALLPTLRDYLLPSAVWCGAGALEARRGVIAAVIAAGEGADRWAPWWGALHDVACALGGPAPGADARAPARRAAELGEPRLRAVDDRGDWLDAVHLLAAVATGWRWDDPADDGLHRPLERMVAALVASAPLVGPDIARDPLLYLLRCAPLTGAAAGRDPARLATVWDAVDALGATAPFGDEAPWLRAVVASGQLRSLLVEAADGVADPGRRALAVEALAAAVSSALEVRATPSHRDRLRALLTPARQLAAERGDAATTSALDVILAARALGTSPSDGAARPARFELRRAPPGGPVSIDVDAGTPLTIAVPVRVPPRLGPAQVGVGVVTRDGRVALGPNSAGSDVPAGWAGTGVFTVERPELAPGRYRLVGGVFDRLGDRPWLLQPGLGGVRVRAQTVGAAGSAVEGSDDDVR